MKQIVERFLSYFLFHLSGDNLRWYAINIKMYFIGVDSANTGNYLGEKVSLTIFKTLRFPP